MIETGITAVEKKEPLLTFDWFASSCSGAHVFTDTDSFYFAWMQMCVRPNEIVSAEGNLIGSNLLFLQINGLSDGNE